ncbi:uncharacterized protein LOC110847568 [Folsomia candida]|uniref:Uncharacterized protein n=1 Tax=Folsomia candida TaxID=158441 RepID=A0A226EHS6_FOLCA|nr:uncharacterized protein LOC110847568 [Folsomia candida]OXA57172.1 hypothetical protein Fcan01_06665 [Folsomia candida]
MSTPITNNGDEEGGPPRRQTRFVTCIVITQALILIFFAVCIAYMHLSVETAYETEYVEDEPSSGTEIFALDHFPGFRFSFTGLVLCLILTEVVLKKGNGTRCEGIFTLILLIASSILFFYIQFYQHKHDRFLSEFGDKTLKIILICVYCLFILSIVSYYLVKTSRLLK